ALNAIVAGRDDMRVDVDEAGLHPAKVATRPGPRHRLRCRFGGRAGFARASVSTRPKESKPRRTGYSARTEASLAMPVWKTCGLCPCVRFNPAEGVETASYGLLGPDRGIACDAGLEDVRALPVRPFQPGRRSRNRVARATRPVGTAGVPERLYATRGGPAIRAGGRARA